MTANDFFSLISSAPPACAALNLFTPSRSNNPREPHQHCITDKIQAIQSAMESVQNHPAVQNLKNGEVCHERKLQDAAMENADASIASLTSHEVTTRLRYAGPVGQSVQQEKEKIGSEFQSISDARTTPEQPAATGQPLTRAYIACN